MANPKITLIAEPPFEDVLVVARAMRQRDAEEIYAIRWHEDPEALAAEVVTSGAFRWGAYYEGRPVAMIGACPLWPNVWTVWSFGTDEWNRVAPALAKHARKFMLPALEGFGVIRAFCWSMEAHTDACRWLEFLGATAEVTLDNYGKNGQRFVCYGWTRNPPKQTPENADVLR